MIEPGQPTPPAFDLPCGGRAVFDRSSGISHRCSDCFAVVGSMGMPNQCRELLDRNTVNGDEDDWRMHNERARFFGFGSRDLPASMTS